MTAVIVQGATFYLAGWKDHLKIIVSDPAANPELVYVAQLNTWKPGRDPSCILGPGDHPFIRKKTYVNYRIRHMESVAQMAERAKRREFILRQPVYPEVMERILAGAAVTNMIPLECRQLLKSQGLI